MYGQSLIQLQNNTVLNCVFKYKTQDLTQNFDLDQALLEIVSEQGGKSKEDASEYLSELQQTGRYAKDVY